MLKTLTHPLLLVLTSLFASSTLAQPPASVQGYYRTPALTDNDIVFAAEGDLWRIPIAGGVATRLTTHPGNEASPVVSPDGSTLAFTAQYEGPVEVYTMPIAGGLPMRRTWFGGRSTPVAFGPGTPAPLIVATRRFSTLPNLQLVSISLDTNAVTRIPLEQAADAAFDDAGNLYFTRMEFQGSHTRRYVGGTVEQLWKFSAAGLNGGAGGATEATPLTADYDGTSASPMFIGGRIYFRSDRGAATLPTPTTATIMNIWSMAPNGSDLRQHTFHDAFEVRSPRAAANGTGRIVYQNGADIWLLDLAAGKSASVPITLSTDLDQTREKWVAKPFDYITSAHLSPDGERVAITARGQVFVAPRKYGRLVEATRSSTVRARDARFMPDGKSLLALSDQSGEVELWTMPADGLGEPAQLTSDAEVLRWEAIPAPALEGSSRHIAHHDKNQRLWIFDTNTKTSKKIDENPVDGFGDLRWSPDGRWLAYASYSSNLHLQLKLYDTQSGSITPITTDRTSSYSPAWSPDGKFLYFLSDRHFESVVDSPWGPDQPEPFFDQRTRVYAVALKPGERWPFAEPDELTPKEDKKEDTKDESKDQSKDQPKPDKPITPGMDSERTDTKPAPPESDKPSDKPTEKPKQPEKPKPVEITLEGLTERIYPTPVPPGNYGSLCVNGKALFMLSVQAAKDAKPNLVAFAIDEPAMKKREWKIETLAPEVKSIELSADGKSLLIQTDKSLHIIDAAAGKPDDLGKAAVNLSGWKFPLRPRDEWRQMYNEAWRLHRDYFYDRSMHGVDWPSIKTKYAPLVDRVASRADLSDVLAQMIGELSALHHFVVGGDSRSGTDPVQPASLGAALSREAAAGGWRIDTIWQTDPDEPDRYSPLAAPGLDFKPGDIITRINGVEALSTPDPAELLRDRAGEQVLIHYLRPGDAPGAEPRRAIVKPFSLGDDQAMRWDHWRLERRKMVETLGNGDIGYIHLKAMGGEDMADFTRQYYPVFTRKGLIIDARHNGGGNIDSWVLSRLMRKAWFFWQGRVGEPTWNMQYAFRGHMVVLCNEHTGSDGEAFSEGFRRLGLGKVIGTRTWGGEIWLSFSNYLVDKGIASAAEIGVYGPEGAWLIEGRGVEPDMIVDNLPHATFRGEDAQLKAAVAELQKQIREKPVEVPPAPKRPDKSWKPAR